MARTRIRVNGAWEDLSLTGPPGADGADGSPGTPGPAGGGIPVVGYISGALVVGAGSARIYNDTGGDLEIANARVSLTVAPAGSSAIFDVNLNGTTIFTTQANRPTVPAGSLTSGPAVPAVTTWPNGQYLTVDVDQIGSSTPGSNATVQIGLG